MGIVKKGREWVIKTHEDYENAMKVLDGNRFCAAMSDDYRREQEEEREIRKQENEVRKQALALGLI